MSARRDDLREVVLLKVGDEGLNLLDGALLVAVEQAVEGREVVDELGAWCVLSVSLIAKWSETYS